MPWIVIIFGIAVGPLGAVSILLVILQPVVYDSFCTLCLASAVISLAMIGPAVDEVLASLQFLKRRRAPGRSVWRRLLGHRRRRRRRWDGARRGGEGGLMVARLLAVVAGIWLMISPAALHYVDAAVEASDRIAGPVAAAFSFVAIWGIARALRWATLPIGLYCVVAPWLLGFPTAAAISNVAAGSVLVATTFFRGEVDQRYGGGWMSLRDACPGAPGHGSG
jgi:hypothetical protein